MTTIDDKTKINLFVVFGAMPFIIGFILWLSSVDAKATKGAEARDILEKIDRRLIRIETKLGTKPENEEE